MFGLAEVARLARPGDLGGMTAVFQVASYTGFATPYLLSVLRTDASAAVLAALTLMVTAWQANRTAEHPRCRLARRILALAQQLPGLVVLLPAIRLPLSGCRTSDIGDRDGNVARPCSTAEPYPARARTVVAPADRNRTARHASQTSLITSMPRYRRRLLWRNLLTGCIAPFPKPGAAADEALRWARTGQGFASRMGAPSPSHGGISVIAGPQWPGQSQPIPFTGKIPYRAITPLTRPDLRDGTGATRD